MYDIITIGTATRDAFAESASFVVKKDRAFPTGEAFTMAAGAKIEIGKIVFTTGGGATNAAVTFARQGFRTACAAKVGDDVSGEEVLRGLRREGVDGRFLVKTPLYPTAYAVLLLAPSGERTILVYRGASERLLPRDIRWEALRAKWYFVFPGKALAVMEAALRHARPRRTHVALNPSGPMLAKGQAYFKRIARMVDVLIMNREEGSRITGVPFGNEEAIFRKLDKWTPGLIVLSDGKRGVTVSDGRTLYKAGAFKERALVSRAGAGDAFGSGFVAGLLRRTKELGLHLQRADMGGAVCDLYPREVIEYAIRLGSANATSVVEHIGAKTGILTKKGFTASRWKKLPISERQLSA